jgi:hypothetical protein
LRISTAHSKLCLGSVCERQANWRRTKPATLWKVFRIVIMIIGMILPIVSITHEFRRRKSLRMMLVVE